MNDSAVAKSQLLDRPAFWAVCAAALSTFLLVNELHLNLNGPLTFDDAFMFYRYASHIREGLGVVWNASGAPTYGITSHGWLLVVVLMAGLPMSPAAVLQSASWITGAVGLAMLFRGLIVRGASGWSAALASAAPLALLMSPYFRYHLTTGMDTMLAFAVNVLIALGVFDYLRRPDRRMAFVLGGLAFLAFLVRPDGGLCALGAPLLAWLHHRRLKRYGDLVGLIAVPALLIGLSIGLCQLYFGVPLPLSFYAKSAGSYEGFQGEGGSPGYLLDFMKIALPFLVVGCVARMRPHDWGVFFLPVGLTIIYFMTVNQVMGWLGRFYIPLLPYIVIPVCLALDLRLARRTPIAGREIVNACLLTIAAVTAFATQNQIVSWHVEATLPEPVRAPAMPIAANAELPQADWFESITRFSEDIASKVPPGTVIAASEVGYLGFMAPQAEIIDLVGLNDTEIGMRRFSAERLVERKPDLIWLPHTHYTGMRAEILSSRKFHDQYALLSGAYNFGLAIRRDSPRDAQIMAIVEDAWPRLYPQIRLEDHVVQTDRLSLPAPRQVSAQPTGQPFPKD